MKSKLASTMVALVAGFLLVGNVSAVSISDYAGGEEDLYQVWNTLFADDHAGSSQALFDDYGVPDGTDWYWRDMGGSIRATVRYAGFGQALGYRSDGSIQWLRNPVGPGYNIGAPTAINVPGGGPFTWVERANGYLWYSDSDRYRPQDHFAAFWVPDTLVGQYEEKWGVDLGEMVYLIAFEDTPGLGDRDYNDLVAVVDMVKPVPEPGTMLLLGCGLIGLAGIGRRKFLKK